jgi:hypothetical protein
MKLKDTHTRLLLLWTRDRPVTEISTWQHTTITTDRHPCTQRDSKKEPQQVDGRRPAHPVWLITTRVVIIVGGEITLFLRVSYDLTPSGTAVQTQDLRSPNWHITVAYRGGDQPPPPPEIPKFEKAEPNSQFRGKYIRNRLVFLFHDPN